MPNRTWKNRTINLSKLIKWVKEIAEIIAAIGVIYGGIQWLWDATRIPVGPELRRILAPIVLLAFLFLISFGVTFYVNFAKPRRPRAPDQPIRRYSRQWRVGWMAVSVFLLIIPPFIILLAYQRVPSLFLKIPAVRAIVIAGYDPAQQRYLNTAEVYDPVADRWEPTLNPIPVPSLCGAAAARVGNGRIVLVGGGGENGSPCSDGIRSVGAVRMYDPNTNRWGLWESMRQGRSQFGLAELPGGRVFVFGGCAGACFGPVDGGPQFVSLGYWGEIYNPLTGGWRQTSPACVEGNCKPEGAWADDRCLRHGEPPGTLWPDERDPERISGERRICTPRQAPRAVAVGGGAGVLVCGGINGVSTPLRTCDLYDVNYDVSGFAAAWTDAGSMPVGGNVPMIALRDGRVLAIPGGGLSYMLWSSTSNLPPSRGEWEVREGLQVRQDRPAMTLLPDGRVMITGGTDGQRPVNAVQVYDSRSDAWSVLPSLQTARTGHVAIALGEWGHVLVAGGRDSLTGDAEALNTAELYDPWTQTWRHVKPMNAARDGPFGFAIQPTDSEL